MVKIECSFPAPRSLAEEALKRNGKYDRSDVIERLKKDFHDKCYICEMKGLQDPNVEHLFYHKNGKYPEKKFDWENLFWSCGRCNGIKANGAYDGGILDCCKQDPEKCLRFRLKGEDVEVAVSDPGDDVQKRTAMLVIAAFSLKNTGMRNNTGDVRLKMLQQEMNVLYKQLEKMCVYPDSKVVMRTVRSLLRRESAFAAFKRCYVREHAAEYPQLQQHVALDS